jgi:hypothetical protein
MTKKDLRSSDLTIFIPQNVSFRICKLMIIPLKMSKLRGVTLGFRVF